MEEMPFHLKIGRAQTLWLSFLGEPVLSGAYLSFAFPNNAHLRRAKGVTDKQLAATRMLEGTTIPDG